MYNTVIKRTLFVNVTRQCNVNCPRCYLTESSRKKSELIPLSYLEKILSSDYYSSPNVDTTVIFEGGELSLIGEENLRELLLLTKTVLPRCTITMVSNCYSMPNWLIALCHEYMNSIFETTYAMGNKFSLSMDHDKYQDKFMRSIQKAIFNDLKVTINIELNKETYEQGIDNLWSYLVKTQCKSIEFDHSIHFDEFLNQPVFNAFGAPLLTTTISYQQHSDFIISFLSKYKDEMKSRGINTSILPNRNLEKSGFFNVKETQNMLSINADGNITTNVMWSDLPDMSLGNISTDDLDSILNNPKRKNLIAWEMSHRTLPCVTCEHYDYCKGGSSYIPLFDELNNECAGIKQILDKM